MGDERVCVRATVVCADPHTVALPWGNIRANRVSLARLATDSLSLSLPPSSVAPNSPQHIPTTTTTPGANPDLYILYTPHCAYIPLYQLPPVLLLCHPLSHELFQLLAVLYLIVSSLGSLSLRQS